MEHEDRYLLEERNALKLAKEDILTVRVGSVTQLGALEHCKETDDIMFYCKHPHIERLVQ